MSKNAKKITVLESRIVELEAGMKTALQKKSSGKVAFDVPGCLRKIADLRKDISNLK
jgi:hypothetical protein